MVKKQIVAQCSDCHQAFTDGAQLYMCCPACRETRKAAWTAEHTRHAGDTRSGWLINDLCYVTLKGIEYKAKIIDMSDVSRAEKHAYLLTKLELTKTLDVFGEKITRTWIHPEPVQTYKLRKRVE